MPQIFQLRQRASQHEDLTTDPEYFLAVNTSTNRRMVAVFIRHHGELEACVFFFEHCRFGIRLGLCRGGDGIGEGLVAGGCPAWRIQYIHLATRALLENKHFHGVSLAILAPVETCLSLMGPADPRHHFARRTVAHTLPLAATYRETLANMGRGTRRSLDGKRRQLEQSKQIVFVPSLPPELALEAMLELRKKANPRRQPAFYRARYTLMQDRAEFFCMGLRLVNGRWLSVLGGWRHADSTCVDVQLNHEDYRKESISAVMRSYLLEYETSFHKSCIHFVGGTSILLRRYCTPQEPATYAFFSRPCLLARLLGAIVPRLKRESVYERFSRTTSMRFDKSVTPEQRIRVTAP